MLLRLDNVYKEVEDPRTIEDLMRHGYKRVYTAKDEPETEEAVDLTKITVKDLKELAALRGYDNVNKLRKAELIALLERGVTDVNK